MGGQGSFYKNYPNLLKVDKSRLKGSSLDKMLSLISPNNKVLDLGCATGYFAKLLQDKNCSVVGIDINPAAAKEAEQYCERVIVADLDNESAESLLKDEQFDVVTFGDVLEHLKDPWSLLESIKKNLKPEGYVIASIPNIAHGAVRLALLEGRFDYANLGILDDTHLRFFTRESVFQLFRKAGFFIETEEHTYLPWSTDSPLIPKINEKLYSPDLLRLISEDRTSEILQFVVRAYPWSLGREHEFLRQENSRNKEALNQVTLDLQELQLKLQNTESKLQDTESKLQGTESKLQDTESKLRETQLHLQSTLSTLEEIQMNKFWRLSQSLKRYLS